MNEQEFNNAWNHWMTYWEERQKAIKDLYRDTKIGQGPIFYLEQAGLILDKEFLKEKFEIGYDFKKLRLWGDLRIQKLANWCGFAIKPITKTTHLVSGEPWRGCLPQQHVQ